MASDYLLQVVHKTDGRVVAWAPGRAVEQELIADLIARVKAKGVGFARTEAHVLADVEAALRDLLWQLKSRV